MTYDPVATGHDDTLGTNEVPCSVAAPDFETTEAYETAKYIRMWGVEGYHGHSPGAVWATRLPGITGNIKHQQTVIDLGCGAGESAPPLFDHGLDIAQVDLADFRTKPEYRGWTDVHGSKHFFPFRHAPLWGAGWSFAGTRHARADLGFCCDVMEHIPTEYVMLVLERIRQNTQACFFSIAHMPDRCGHVIGETLHLTLRPFEWWRDRISEQMGEIVVGRDLMGESIFYVRCR